MSLRDQTHRRCSDRLAPFPGFLYSLQPEYLHAVGREGPFSADSPTAHYSAMIMGGGGVPARGRCNGGDATVL